MPGQNFIAVDFFVTASEDDAIKAVALLPQHRRYLTLLKENPLLKTRRFLYEHSDKSVKSYVDVSILPLDGLHVRFGLHGSYTNGQPVDSDQHISASLQDFQQLVQAALENDRSRMSSLKIIRPVQNTSFSWLRIFFRDPDKNYLPL